MKRFVAVLLICLLALCGLLSCGLEAFYYLDFIPQGDYMDITRATVTLPSNSDDGYSTYFTNFVIFYRIYVSNEPRDGKIDTDDLRIVINQTLNSDFLSLYSYTDITSTTVSTANLENIFLNRKYFKLELKEDDITKVLDSKALGKNLEIVFSTNNGENPTLSLDGGNTTYTLLRANGKETPGFDFYPKPDNPADLFRTFLNHPELYDAANAANSQINPDVVASSSPAILHYTYVSMYIAAIGKSLETPPSTIYSQPTFLGIFRLAEWS